MPYRPKPRSLRRGLLSCLRVGLGAGGIVGLGLGCTARGPEVETPVEESKPPANPQVQGVFEPGAQGRGEAPPPLPSAPLAVVDYGPEGRTEGGADLHVRFDQPVGALELDGESLEGVLAIDPPMPGRTFWRSPELLVFTPEESWQPARRYSVRLAKPLTNAEGSQTYDAPLEWSFETPRPQVVQGGPITGDVRRRHRRTELYVVFDEPVSLAEARAHIQASARRRSESELDRGDGLEMPGEAGKRSTKVGVRVQRLTKQLHKQRNLEDEIWAPSYDRTFLVSPRGLWPGSSTVTVEVTPGLKSESGPLGLETPWRRAFATYGPQKLLGTSCDSDGVCPLAPVTIDLRNPIKERELKKIKISPKPKNLEIGLVDVWDEESGGREILIEGMLLPGTTYTVTLPPGLRDIYGQTLGKAETIRATIDRQPTIGLSSRNATLIAGRPRTFGVTTRHIRAIEVKVAELDARGVAALQVHDSGIPWPTGAKTVRKTIRLEPKGATDWAELALDLQDFIGGRRGAFVVNVSALESVPEAEHWALPVDVRGVFRVTDLGIAAITSQPQSVVRIVDLQSGAPVAAAKARFVAEHGKSVDLGTTDADGLLGVLPEQICGPRSAKAEKGSGKKTGKKTRKAKKGAPSTQARRDCDASPRGRGVIVVDGPGEDRAYLNLNAPEPESAEAGLRPGERLIGKLITERGVYRPGERVHILGWSAITTPFRRSNLRRPKRASVAFVLKDPRGEVVAEAKGKTSAEGKLTTTLRLPEAASLGSYTVEAMVYGKTLSARLKVEDFRTPEFEVGARALKPDVVADGGQRVQINANYYFGGGVDLNRVSYVDICDAFLYRPPGLDPRWRVGAYEDRWLGQSRGPTVRLPALRPPAKGERAIALSTMVRTEGLAERCTVNVEVREASLQAIGAEASYIAHPASFYVAIQTPERSLYVGDRYAVPLRAVHYDGHRLGADGVEVEVERTYDAPRYRKEDGKRVLYGHASKTETVKRCSVRATASGGDGTCALDSLKKGTYRVIARAKEGTHRTRSEAKFSVRERPKSQIARSWPKPSRFEILTSSDEVKPGDRLSVYVQSPWSLQGGVLAIERSGIREYVPLHFDKDGRARVELEVDDTWTPGVFFEALAVRNRGKYSLPRLARANARVGQGFEHRRLGVSVSVPAEAGPRDKVEVTVKVQDADGKPSAGRVGLWAVDEAVLSLTSYEVPDLLPTFIPRAVDGTYVHDEFSTLRLPFIAQSSDPYLDVFNGGSIGLGGGGSGYGRGSGSAFGGRGRRVVAPAARSRFETTPAFFADLAVDASGERRTTIELPDNLTTFRVLAVASGRLVDGQSPGRVGVGDARIRVTRPMVLRPALPRLIRPGDESEVAAIIQNRTDQPGEVTVKVSLKGDGPAPIVLTSEATITAPIAAEGQVRIPTTIRAKRPGEPEIELQATFVGKRGAKHQDAVRLPLEVKPERTLVERVATYGTVADDQPIAVPLRMPDKVLPDFGGITVSTTSTLLGGVEDAVHGLIHYPYGCVEQTASRLLPLVAIADLGNLIPQDVDVDGMVAAGVERILSMQVTGGGFAYWPGGKAPVPYASAYATWVLMRAKRAGFRISESALEKAFDYLEGIVGAQTTSTGHGYGHLDDVRRAIAVHTLVDAGRRAPKTVDDLYARRASLPLFARAFLLMAIHGSDPEDARVGPLASELLGNLKETGAEAHAMESVRYNLSGVFHSDGRSDAIVLSALLQVKGEHPLLPKLVRGIMGRRAGGSWRNTQENAYSVLALADYVRVYEKEIPDFVARAWVGPLQVLDAVFRGRETETRSGELPMAPLLAGLAGERSSAKDLIQVILERRGQGRLYYRIGAEWAPIGLDLPARSQGLEVRRTLRTEAGALAEGQALAPGSRVAMDVVVNAESRTPYVAIDVPIPAGLEPVQRNLGKGHAATTLGGRRGFWVDYEEERADRVVIFADDLQPGAHRHSVNLRATTPGRYTMPPATAEAMYMPEVYGRSASTKVEVAAP